MLYSIVYTHRSIFQEKMCQSNVFDIDMTTLTLEIPKVTLNVSSITSTLPNSTMKSIRPIAAPLRSCSRLPITSLRLIHSTCSNSANPIPHPAAPAPPPPPPTIPTTDREERIARKKRQAELLHAARNIRSDPNKSTSPLKRRFWTDVTLKRTDGKHLPTASNETKA